MFQTRSDYQEVLDLLKLQMELLVLKTANVSSLKHFKFPSHYDSAIFTYFNKTQKASVTLKLSQQEAKTQPWGKPHQEGTFYGL